MKKQILLIIPAIMMLAVFCVLDTKAQTSEELLKREKEKKFYKAKHRVDQGGGGWGYSGGELAPIGATFYMLYPKKIGFYSSFRASFKEVEDNPKYENATSIAPFKNLVLNVGITKNFAYPFGLYLAAGISDYITYGPKENYSTLQEEWNFGADVSGGIMITVLREFNFMGGVSLYNFSKPEICFGLGWNYGR